jgi:FkbM family methyltransferase
MIKNKIKHKKIMNDWFKVRDDLIYPLSKESIILDFGAYNGKWAEKFHNKYGSNIYCFEPIKEFYNLIDQKFHPRNVAVGGSEGKISISLSKDGSSFFIDKGDTTEVNIVNASNIFNQFDRIDFVKINVEGSEYDILESLYKSNLLSKADMFLIQFHDCNGYETRLKKSRDYLSKTHKQIWNYDFIWEFWKK